MTSIFTSLRPKSPNHQPPEPKSSSFGGYKTDYFRNPFSFLSKCVEEYGDIVLLDVGNYKFYLISSLDYIEQILVKNSSNFGKSDSGKLMYKILGNGLVSSEGNFWQRQRKLVQPAFHHKHLVNFQDLILSSTNRSIANWESGETREIYQEIKDLIVENMMEIMFFSSIATHPEKVKEITEVGTEFFTIASDRSLYSFPGWIPTPIRLRLAKKFGLFDSLIYEMIRQRRSTTEDKADMLSMLQSVRDVDGTGMTDKQVRDEIMTLTVAACETVPAALSWMWYLLSQHPEVEAKLKKELQTVLNGRKPSFTDFGQLRYTEMVIMETLRLYPPDWLLGRKVLKDWEIGGYVIPAGSNVSYSQWVIHRDKRFFDKPEVFNPERWNSDLSKTLPKFAYFPFGGGSRSCVGKPLAMMLMMLITATIAQKFRLSLAPNHQVIPFPGITLRPKYGIKMLVNQG